MGSGSRADRDQSLHGIKPPAAEGESDRVLSDEELRAVWRASDALEQPYGAFIKLLVLTGARRNEAARMRWSEVDLEAKTWTLPAARARTNASTQFR